MQTKYIAVSLFALAAALPSLAWGQEDEESEVSKPLTIDQIAEQPMALIQVRRVPNDEILVTAHRDNYIRKQEKTSASTAFDGDILVEMGGLNIDEVLRRVPGASVSRSGGIGGLTELRLRGAENNHVLVLIDGVKQTNPATGQIDFSTLPLSTAKGVEVLRGEQSAIWGSDAIGGVINIRTDSLSDRIEFNPAIGNWVWADRYDAQFEGGSRDTLQGSVSAVIPSDLVHVFIHGSALETAGHDVSGLGGEDDGASRNQLGLRAEFHPGSVEPALTLFFNDGRFQSQFDEDLDFDGRLDNSASETTIDRRSFGATFQGSMDFAELNYQLSLSQFNESSDCQNCSFENLSKGRRDSAVAIVDFNIADETIVLLAESDLESFSNNGGPGAFQNQRNSIRNTGLGADYRREFGDGGQIDITASARYDINDRFDDAVTWRLGAGFDIDAVDGRLRASVGKGVKNPTMTEIFGFFPGSFEGNPNIQPETSTGFNIGWEQSLLDGTLDYSLDYFRSELTDEIFTDFSVFPSTVRNRDTDSSREGLEFEGRWSPVDQLSLRATATWLNAEENGTPELRRPEFIASATATYRPEFAPLTATLKIDHNGEMLDTDFATFQVVTLDAFTLIGANLIWDINDEFALTLRGENLTDEAYTEVVGYASQGRSIYAGLRLSY